MCEFDFEELCKKPTGASDYISLCRAGERVRGRQPVPHDGAEEHPGVHDGLADGAAAVHHAGGRALPVQGEADLHHPGAAGGAVPAESRCGAG